MENRRVHFLESFHSANLHTGLNIVLRGPKEEAPLSAAAVAAVATQISTLPLSLAPLRQGWLSLCSQQNASCMSHCGLLTCGQSPHLLCSAVSKDSAPGIINKVGLLINTSFGWPTWRLPLALFRASLSCYLFSTWIPKCLSRNLPGYPCAFVRLHKTGLRMHCL